MGASHSQVVRMDSTPTQNPPVSKISKRPEESDDFLIPTPPPQYQRVETFEQKLYRKFTTQPLVPIGAVLTAYCLGSGIKSFMNRDIARSQTMMRARVAAQFGTIAIFIGYAGFNEFQFNWVGTSGNKEEEK